MKNLFIVIEGIDGSGKDTQLERIFSYLLEENKYRNIWKTSEPSQLTESGKDIIKLKESGKWLSGIETAKLFSNDRKETSRIKQEILQHSTILCSRYDYSTYGYQWAQWVAFEDLYNLHQGIIIPDITFYIQVSFSTAWNRIKKRWKSNDSFEQKDFLMKVHKKYEEVMNKLKKSRKIIFINWENDIATVSQEIQKELTKFLL